MLFFDPCCEIAQYEINVCEDDSLSMELGDMLLPLIRFSDRFGAIWGRLCTREQGHAFLDAPISEGAIM